MRSAKDLALWQFENPFSGWAAKTGPAWVRRMQPLELKRLS